MRRNKTTFVSIGIPFLIAFLGLCFFLHLASKRNRNFVAALGLALSDNQVGLEYAPAELLYHRHYLTAKLSRVEARGLRSQFLSRPASETFVMPVSPRDMPPLPGFSQWKPQKTTQYWAGSFVATAGSEYNCVYIFDLSRHDYVELYFYAVASVT